MNPMPKIFPSLASYSTLTLTKITNNHNSIVFLSYLLDYPGRLVCGILLPLLFLQLSKCFPNISIPSRSTACYPSPPLRISYNNPTNASLDPIDLM